MISSRGADRVRDQLLVIPVAETARDSKLAEKLTQDHFAFHKAVGLNMAAFSLCDLGAIVKSFGRRGDLRMTE